MAALLYEALLTFASVKESEWLAQDRIAACFPASLERRVNEKASSKSRGMAIATQRAALKFISSTLGYAVMLLTMTFNLGLFFAVMLGLAAGTLMFTGYAKRARILNQESEQDSLGTCCG